VPDPVELLGYAASALVVLSLTMGSLLRLRVVSLVGSLTFASYGALIGSVPVLVTNAAIAVINVVHLVRIWRDRSARAYFEVLPVPPDSPVLRRFASFYAEDIRRFQPRFDGIRDDHLAWMVLRDAVPAGVVLAVPDEEGTARVEVDYVTAPHRDFRAGSVLYDGSGAFPDRGFTRVVADAATSAHRRYLARMGFTADDGDRWSREVR
jgi:hypothetical protein